MPPFSTRLTITAQPNSTLHRTGTRAGIGGEPAGNTAR
jgi:hypothetical protein